MLTIKDLLDSRRFAIPQTAGVIIMYKRAPKAKVVASGPGQLPLLLDV